MAINGLWLSFVVADILRTDCFLCGLYRSSCSFEAFESNKSFIQGFRRLTLLYFCNCFIIRRTNSWKVH